VGKALGITAFFSRLSLVASVARKVLFYQETGSIQSFAFKPTVSEILDVAEEERVQEAGLWASKHRVRGLPVWAIAKVERS
jgi:hypothetical protein